MPLKLSIKGGVMRCGRCGQRYSNPLTHTCTVRLGSKRDSAGSRLSPKASASVTCSRCGKPYANALTHVCAPKSDFKKRAAAAGRRKKADEARARRKAEAGGGGCPQEDGRTACRGRARLRAVPRQGL
jgi:hypothetical protein